MNNLKKSLFAFSLVLVAGFQTSQAASITGLVNTGVNVSGNVDTSYNLIGGTSFVDTSGAWPINGTWLLNDSTSKWITPGASAGTSYDPSTNGIYDYQLKFDLSGFNPVTASFMARFSTDNAGYVALNGNKITGSDSYTFNDWTSFSANSGFIAGVNTLDFVVTNYAQNGGNPSGLRVEFLGSQIAAVPEPHEWAMMALGLVLLGLAVERKKPVRF